MSKTKWTKDKREELRRDIEYVFDQRALLDHDGQWADAEGALTWIAEFVGIAPNTVRRYVNGHRDPSQIFVRFVEFLKHYVEVRG